MNTNQSPSNLTTVRILWGALMMSILIYVGISFVVAGASETAPADAELLQIMQMGFAALSTMMVAIGSFIPRIFLSDTAIIALVPKGTTDRDEIERLLLPKFFTASLLRFAMFESIAVYGFVLAFLAHDGMMIVPFAAVALVMDVIFFPKTTPLVERTLHLVR